MDGLMLLLPTDLSTRASILTSDLELHHGPLAVLHLETEAVLSLAVFRGRAVEVDQSYAASLGPRSRLPFRAVSGGGSSRRVYSCPELAPRAC